MTADTRTETERRYDAERDGTLYFPQPAANHADDARAAIDGRQARELGGEPATVAEQIAAIRPHDTLRNLDIPIVALPGGIAINRPTIDGRIGEWVQVTLGGVSIDVQPDGTIAGVAIGEHYIDDVPTDTWMTLLTLLAGGVARFAWLAALPEDVRDAIAEWHRMPFAEQRRVSTTIGFAEWYRRRHERRG